MFSLGLGVRDFVLGIASLLKQEAAPGYFTLALVCLLAVSIVIYSVVVVRRRKALRWLQAQIDATPVQSGFGQSVDTLTASLKIEAKSAEREHIFDAWAEYRETFVAHDEGDITILRNSVRPSSFFNIEDLGFTAGFWRIVPSLFVSIGLFLTFLGLISALHAMNLTEGNVKTSLNDLLTIASAKFIMSLTGLLCSIIFTVILRIGTGSLERDVHQLCRSIEKRLTFISLEDLASEQLRATRDQREHLKTLAHEMVAELGRPLREELPAAISTSIGTAMAPLIAQIGQVSSDGMGSMVKDLSARLTDDVGRALGDASRRLVEAGERIGGLADRMDQSSGRMGEEMNTAVTRLAQAVDDLRHGMGDTAATAAGALTQGTERLLSVMNQTLEGIRDNTAEGARAMSAASGELRAAAESFRVELTRASREGADAARQSLTATTADAGGAIQASIAGLAEAMADVRTEMSRSASTASGVFEKGTERLLSVMSQTLEGIRDNTAEGARAMSAASGELRAAAESFRVELTRASREGADAARQSLTTATADAGGAIQASIAGLAEAMAEVRTEMSRSASTASGVFEKGTERLLSVMSQTLEGIRDNTAEGARAMSAASGELRAAAESFRVELTRASREGADAARQSLTAATADAGGAIQASIAGLAEAMADVRTEMSRSASTASGVFEKGSERLLSVMSQTLEGIRDNTAEGARAMSAAAGELRASSEVFRSELERASREGAEAARSRLEAASAEAGAALDTAGRSLLDAFGTSSIKIAQIMDGLSDRAGRDLFAPLDAVAEKIGAMSSSLEQGAQSIRRLADGIRAGSEATENAATTFKAAAKDMADAALPIRTSTDRIETAVIGLEQSTRHVGQSVMESARATAQAASDALDTAYELLGGQDEAIKAALGAIPPVLDRLRAQASQIDDIDMKLASAFDAYEHHVRSAVGTLFEHVRSMNEQLAPALDTMREVVEQAEQFVPETRRR